ncbi:hypothetical protein VPH35_054592 [Triticum aestivum]|uniref:Uncharacterized protein n=1 Tax=Triticum aestivum TaxID=4565 RepID=A0A077S6I9_WHEAT|nr:unnamed protein product [Triticum aestivum]CDM85517.1 unnamed protein product [Triticum aestivum]
MYSETSTDGLNEVPLSLEDPDYKGLELDLMAFCEKHGKPSERLVAFEGTMTGRSVAQFQFSAAIGCLNGRSNAHGCLATAKLNGVLLFCLEGQNCGFVQWVDEQWPPTMENALLKLWSMVEESKCARVNDNLKSALTIYQLTEEKNKLDAYYDKLVKDVHQLVDMQEDRVVDFSYLQSNITYQQECRAELVAGMKAEMAKKDAATEKLQQRYEILCNLTSAQATVIQNLKLKI